MAVNMILDDLREGIKHGKTGEIDDETGFCRETLLIKTAIEKANATIYQTAQRQPQCHGMGTTVVARTPRAAPVPWIWIAVLKSNDRGSW